MRFMLGSSAVYPKFHTLPSFDQARLIRHNRILARNGIDPSGQFLSSQIIKLSLFMILQACHWTRRPSHGCRIPACVLMALFEISHSAFLRRLQDYWDIPVSYTVADHTFFPFVFAVLVHIWCNLQIPVVCVHSFH